jgi:hypothetical protein
MNCQAAARLYVRANGTVPCNCDTGETTTLFKPRLDDLKSFDYVEDCFNGPPFVMMRERLLASLNPIQACSSCYFFRPSEPFLKYGVDGRLQAIDQIQIESSFLCGVDCEACVLRSTRTDPALSALGDGPYEMPLELFHKLVDDIVRAGVHVGELAFCGRGEPLLHKDFTAMMRHARERLPRTFFSVVTSGNAPFHEGLLDVDHLSVSIDGGFPDSYEVYRKGGNLKRVLRFVESVVSQRRPTDAPPAVDMPQLATQMRTRGKPIVCWKYILFEHNDSEEEIVHAQQLAHDLGVDEMMFVLTHTWNRSKKYVSQAQIEALPEFKVFDGRRKTFSNVNLETDNMTHWDAIGETPREQRFRT